MSERLPCLSGDDVINNCARNLMAELRSLVSAPTEIYQSLYVVLLYRFAEFCQAMPLNQDSAPYSLFLYQLNQSIAALKLRRGLLLPPNESAETIAREEPLWTFAVFSAALLYSLPDRLLNKQIYLYSDLHSQGAIWNPLDSSFYQLQASH